MGLSGKLKRKDIDIVNDDFSDFSLSSPATKIRRLDTDLPPIIEEEESFPENQERAIVLFNSPPLHDNSSNPLLRSPSTLSISLNPELISGFKSQFLRSSDMESADFDEEAKTKLSKNLAIVPWVPSQVPLVDSRDGEVEFAEPMEASDEMDIEQENNDGLKANEVIHHWPQQHCMIPQPPVNPLTPITWSQMTDF